MVGTFDKNTPRIDRKTFLSYCSLFYQERYIVQFKYTCARQSTNCSMFNSFKKNIKFFFNLRLIKVV